MDPASYRRGPAPAILIDCPQDGRMERVLERGEGGVPAIRGEDVLRQVVRPDAEEVDSPGQLGGEKGGRWHFDHDPGHHPLGRRQAVADKRLAGLVTQRHEQLHVGNRGDHRRHDVGDDVRGSAGPPDCPKLGEKQIGVGVGEADDHGAFWPERLQDAAVGLDLLDRSGASSALLARSADSRRI